jgi:NADPH:quinone reductase
MKMLRSIMLVRDNHCSAIINFIGEEVREMKTTMLAVQIRAYKDVNDLNPREVPMPEPREDEVLVQIHFAGINPSDLANTQGYFSEHTTLPRIVGRDFVGKVVSGPKQLLGKTVMGSGGDIGFTRDGTFAQYIDVPQKGIVEIPDGFDQTQAASLGVPFLAALACLDSFSKDLTGKSLLLIGGAGAVGSAATVIARKRGANVVRTILSTKEIAGLSPQLRDGTFMDLSQSKDLVAQTRTIMQGMGFDLIINMVGGETFEPSVQCLNDHGQIACIATQGQPRVEFNLLDFYRRNLSLYGLNTALDGVVASASKLKSLFQEFETDLNALSCLGQTQVVQFSEAKTVLEKALAKQYRKPVFQMLES